MRFHGLVLIAGVAVLGACGGGDKGANTTDTAASAGTAATSGATTGAAPAGGTGTAAPVTGTVHEVKMIADDKGYRFDPADITIKQGDGIKWVMVSGAPHNVAFENVPADVKAQLDANMPGQKIGELSGPYIMQPNETYEVSFANIKPGKYNYNCTPHLAMGMKGTVTVQ